MGIRHKETESLVMLRVRTELKTKLHRASFSSGLENHSHVRPHDCQEMPGMVGRCFMVYFLVNIRGKCCN